MLNFNTTRLERIAKLDAKQSKFLSYLKNANYLNPEAILKDLVVLENTTKEIEVQKAYFGLELNNAFCEALSKK